LKKTEDDQRFSRGNLRPGARPLSFAARSKNRAAEWNWGAEQRRDRTERDPDALNKTAAAQKPARLKSTRTAAVRKKSRPANRIYGGMRRACERKHGKESLAHKRESDPGRRRLGRTLASLNRKLTAAQTCRASRNNRTAEEKRKSEPRRRFSGARNTAESKPGRRRLEP
jgi:hypothetical protein